MENVYAHCCFPCRSFWHVGVACIPPESFYSQQHAHIGNGYVRFAFCKSDDMLAQVQQRLAKLPQMAQ